jgi:hypothetical protein
MLVIIAMTSPLCARTLSPVVNTAPVSITRFGAVGNGKANCTRAIAAALASGAKDIYVPAGTYVIGPGMVSVPAGVTIRGAGRSSVLRAADGSKTLLAVKKDCTLRDFAVECKDDKPGTIHEGTILAGSGADNVTIDSVVFRDCGRVSVLADHANGLAVRNCDFGNVLMAVHLVFSSRAKILNNSIVNARHSAIRWWGNVSFNQKLTSDLTISGNYVRNTGHGENISDYSGAAISGTGAVRVVMANNIIDGAMDVGLDLEWCDDSVISANTVRNCHNAGIALFFGCKRVSITGNTVLNDYSYAQPPSGFWVRSGIWLAPRSPKEYAADQGHRDVTVVGNTIFCAEGERRSLWISPESSGVTIGQNAISGGKVYDERPQER